MTGFGHISSDDRPEWLATTSAGEEIEAFSGKGASAVGLHQVKRFVGRPSRSSRDESDSVVEDFDGVGGAGAANQGSLLHADSAVISLLTLALLVGIFAPIVADCINIWVRRDHSFVYSDEYWSLFEKFWFFSFGLGFLLQLGFYCIAIAAATGQRRWFLVVTALVGLAVLLFGIPFQFFDAIWGVGAVDIGEPVWMGQIRLVLVPIFSMTVAIFIAHEGLGTNNRLFRIGCGALLVLASVSCRLMVDNGGSYAILAQAVSAYALPLFLLAFFLVFISRRKSSLSLSRSRFSASELSNLWGDILQPSSRRFGPVLERRVVEPIDAVGLGHTFGHPRSEGLADSSKRSSANSSSKQSSGFDGSVEIEEVAIIAELSFHGGTCRVLIAGQEVDLSIPKGIESGERMRLRNFAKTGRDLVVKIRLLAADGFKLSGRDVYSCLVVESSGLVNGCETLVDTLGGRVTVTIPRGSAAGNRLRLRGRGLPARGQGSVSGDHFVDLCLPESFRRLRFCTRCGSEVGAYSWSTGMEPSNYWCPVCDCSWRAPDKGETGHEFLCGHFMTGIPRYCGECGCAAGAPAAR